MQAFLDTNLAIQAFFSSHLFLEILILLLQPFRQSKHDTIIFSQSISITMTDIEKIPEAELPTYLE